MKILLYTNILTPYRKYFYDLFFEECKKNGIEFKVWVMSDNESNRVWHYKDFESSYTQLLPGITVTKGETYIHINKLLKRNLGKFRPNIVIASGSYICPGTWTLAKNKKKYGYQIYFWSESHLSETRSYNGLKIYIREKLRKNFYPLFDGFLCPGKLAFDFVNEYTCNDVKQILLPNLIDESIYNGIDEVNCLEMCEKIHAQGKRILFIPARLSVVKGIVPFIELLGKCYNKDKVELVIAGSGEEKENIERAAKINSVDIHLLGSKTQKEIAELYKMSDIFVMPSLSDPNPLTCVEALWSKKVLLVSEHVGNYPEVIEFGKNGYVFSYKDKNKAVKAIENIIQSSNEWILEAQEKSYEIAMSKYDSKKVCERVLYEIVSMYE